MTFAEYYDGKWLGTASYFQVHRSRFLQTWDFVRKLGLVRSGTVLDIGGVGPIAAYLAEQRGWSLSQTTGDLRHDLKEIGSGEFDLVMCTETIEHIKDRESGEIRDLEAFNFSGVHSLLNELKRSVKPTGFVVVTTPNANSYISLHKWLIGEALMMDPQHVREFSVQDLKSAMERCGLRVVLTEVTTSWDEQFGGALGELKKRLHGMKELSRVPRGDNIMMAGAACEAPKHDIDT